MVLLLLAASLSFTKSFPGSVPDYYSVVLQEDGNAVYATQPDDPNAVRFKVSDELVKQAFELSAKLAHFTSSLESKKKVAFTGKKTFVFEDAGGKKETSFNYSERPEAMELVSLFERLSNTQEASIELQRMMRYDKLGLMKFLLQTEVQLDHKDLAEPILLVPVLEQLSVGKSFMDIVRQRARVVLAKIQTPGK